jgi:hypothetical protein
MGEWIKRNPVAYALINLALCVLIATAVIRIYVDYKVEKKIITIEEKLNRIEQGTDTILQLIKGSYE